MLCPGCSSPLRKLGMEEIYVCTTSEKPGRVAAYFKPESFLVECYRNGKRLYAGDYRH